MDAMVEDEPKSKGRGGVTKAFPLKLHDMIDSVEAEGHSSIVSWQSHGRCFVVHEPKRFAEIVMPKYFKQTKFASFQRQLNLYNFERFNNGRDKGGYYHKLFVRGKRQLCAHMSRIKVKGTKVRKAIQPQLQPNFYAIPPALASSATRKRVDFTSANEDISFNSSQVLLSLSQLKHDNTEQKCQNKHIRPLKCADDETSERKSDISLNERAMVTPPLKPLSTQSKFFLSLSPSDPLLTDATITTSSHHEDFLPSTHSHLYSETLVSYTALQSGPPLPFLAEKKPTHSKLPQSVAKQTSDTIMTSSHIPVSSIISIAADPQVEPLVPQTVDFLSELFWLEGCPHEILSFPYNTETNEYKAFFEGKPFFYIESSKRALS